MKYHLVILKKPYLKAILAGRKTIESRFYRTRRSPVGEVQVGDTLFLKESSGPVCAAALVTAVKNFANLTAQEMLEIKRQHNGQICGDEDYWQSRADCRYGLLVWLGDVRQVPPVRITKKDWRAWVVLNEREDFGLLKRFGFGRSVSP
jgi:ASC-1-like (ASCH) protein